MQSEDGMFTLLMEVKQLAEANGFIKIADSLSIAIAIAHRDRNAEVTLADNVVSFEAYRSRRTG